MISAVFPILLALTAAEPEPNAAMDQAIRDYFEGELEGGAGPGMAAGAASLIAAPFFFALHDQELLEGMAYPIAVVGLLEIVVASVLYYRTDDQAAKLRAQLRDDPAAFRRDEIARMERVNSGFGIYKWVEIGIVAAGLGTGIAGAVVDKPLVAGIGWGAVLQGLFGLMIDLLAEGRADRYTAALTRP